MPRSLPRHVAIVMDGNGRWAESRSLSRSEGHRIGTENVRRVLRRFSDVGVKYVTLFAFSTENWDRPDDEVGFLMELLGRVIVDETPELHKAGVRIKHIGRLEPLPVKLQNAIRHSVDLTQGNDSIILSVACNYGARAEILDAIQAIIRDGIDPADLSEEIFQTYLQTNELPDPDLIIRTAGEMRLSNFLLWQAAYAEYYSTPVFWPDFDEEEVNKALKEYSHRRRRYGKVDAG